MIIHQERFGEILELFPDLKPTLARLNTAEIPHSIGGSVALYIQGHDRKPNDVDFMFSDEAFEQVNELMMLTPQRVERPYNSMNKSTPKGTKCMEFINRYTSKREDISYYSPPLEIVPVNYDGIETHLIVAEKVAVFKLISGRKHHNDLNDFRKLIRHPDFSMDIFWSITDSIDARKVVSDLLGFFHVRR